MIRLATLQDIESLLQLEQACFSYDLLSRDNFRYLLTKAHANILVAVKNDGISGCAILLFRKNSLKARLYSFAVDARYRRQGVASRLLLAAEQCAMTHQCLTLRLETRLDNIPMQQLIAQQGYQKFATIIDYYEDHATALRYEKKLIPHIQID